MSTYYIVQGDRSLDDGTQCKNFNLGYTDLPPCLAIDCFLNDYDDINECHSVFSIEKIILKDEREIELANKIMNIVCEDDTTSWLVKEDDFLSCRKNHKKNLK